MASPQRPEFHGISDASQSGGLRPGHPPAGRRVRFLVIWLICIILIAAFFYWLAWGWEGTGGYWWRNRSEPAQTTIMHPIAGSGLAVLDASDKQPFIGKTFQLSNVPIERKINSRFYWVGSNSQTPMLVVLNGNQNSAEFKSLTNGSRVDIVGTVLKAPPTPAAASQWPLSDPDLGQLEKEGAYIQATEIHTAPK